MKKFLLLQFRDDVSAEHEYVCFKKLLNATDENLHVLNAITDTFEDSPNTLDGYSVLFIGGSGQYNLSHPAENLTKALAKTDNIFKHILYIDFPTFGVCFGHQLLSYHIGHKVEMNDEMAESGMFKILLKPNASTDLVLQEIPHTFEAIEGHKNSVIYNDQIPDYQVLANSEKCPVQMFKYKNNIYGTQFHPELTPDEVVYRYSLYPGYLKKSGKSLKEIKSELKDSPEARQIVLNFIRSYK